MICLNWDWHAMTDPVVDGLVECLDLDDAKKA